VEFESVAGVLGVFDRGLYSEVVFGIGKHELQDDPFSRIQGIGDLNGYSALAYIENAARYGGCAGAHLDVAVDQEPRMAALCAFSHSGAFIGGNHGCAPWHDCRFVTTEQAPRSSEALFSVISSWGGIAILAGLQKS